ncbi:MAG: hypothetical protein ACLFQ8_01155 [Candidatus Aenigmatarchaeota archaeon]
MAAKKGIALPINMLVILAVAVIVLLSVVAFFMGQWDPGAVEAQNVVNNCCHPVATNPTEYCNESSWGGEDNSLHDNVTVSGNEIECSEYVSSPSDCPACTQV